MPCASNSWSWQPEELLRLSLPYLGGLAYIWSFVHRVVFVSRLLASVLACGCGQFPPWPLGIVLCPSQQLPPRLPILLHSGAAGMSEGKGVLCSVAVTKA